MHVLHGIEFGLDFGEHRSTTRQGRYSMDPILIDPTSKDSAVCEPVVLRLTDKVRLVFKFECPGHDSEKIDAFCTRQSEDVIQNFYGVGAV